MSPLTLSLATATLNTRIRSHGLSAKEIWTQRDQITGEQLPLDDQQLILSQHATRLANHSASSKSKAHGQGIKDSPVVQIGELVYILSDRDKNHPRSKYIVTDLSGDHCKLRKFTKSQFRIKEYTVLASNVYPIHQEQPILSLHPVDCDSGSEDDRDTLLVVPPEPVHSVPVKPAPVPHVQVPTPPTELIQPPLDDTPDHTDVADSVEHSQELPQTCPVSHPLDIASSIPRTRRPPAWQTSGVWDMGGE